MFVDDVILYVENLDNAIKIVRTNKKFSESAEYKINTKINFLYTFAVNNLQKKLRKTVLFKITSERMKHLKINLTKEVKDLYTEN